jgi:spore maturation protein CgeB
MRTSLKNSGPRIETLASEKLPTIAPITRFTREIRPAHGAASSLMRFKTNATAARLSLKIVILGLSISSSWDNGHATIYRDLVRELCRRGHDVLFLERDTAWHTSNRDLPDPSHGRTEFYSTIKELKDRFSGEIRNADFVIVGSSVPEGINIGEWVTRVAQGVTAFYDLDTPATVANLIKDSADSISTALIPRYQMYLSLTGGPMLNCIEKNFGSSMARPLYTSVDATFYFPEERELKWDLGYLGAHDHGSQPSLERLLLEPARRWSEGKFIVARPQIPRGVRWPKNVKRVRHLSPAKQRVFYNSQRYTLNLTRANRTTAGFSPNARLLEAAACGTPIISDSWIGLETFFKPDEEILISHSADETLIYLEEIPEMDRRRIGARARECVLAKHTARHRAIELEGYALELLKFPTQTLSA